VTVQKRSNVKSKPWAIVEASTGHIKGRSTTKTAAEASARIRNRAIQRKRK
jgi:hypothetical protein